MALHTRRVLQTGTALLAVSAIGFASAPEPRPPTSTTTEPVAVLELMRFAAVVEPAYPPAQTAERLIQPAALPPSVEQQNLLSILLHTPLRLLGPAKPLGTVTPAPSPEPFSVGSDLADTIDNVYIAVEPWVRWGFQVATDVIAWVPWVGWLAGQTMIFYNFFEGMVQSGVFNFTDWMRGQGGVVENVVDFGVDVFWSFVYLGIDEWNYFLPPLPPLPFPIPPRPPLDQFAAGLAATDMTIAAEEQTSVVLTAVDEQDLVATVTAEETPAITEVPAVPEVAAEEEIEEPAVPEEGAVPEGAVSEEGAVPEGAVPEEGAVPQEGAATGKGPVTEETAEAQDGKVADEDAEGDDNVEATNRPGVESAGSGSAPMEAASVTNAEHATDEQKPDTDETQKSSEHDASDGGESR